MTFGDSDCIPSWPLFVLVVYLLVAPAGADIYSTGANPVTTRPSVTVAVFGLWRSYLNEVGPLAPRFFMRGVKKLADLCGYLAIRPQAITPFLPESSIFIV